MKQYRMAENRSMWHMKIKTGPPGLLHGGGLKVKKQVIVCTMCIALTRERLLTVARMGGGCQ